jgi:hypothetical protein
VTKVVREEMKKFLESNKNENKNHQKLWEKARVMLWGKFIDISAYIKKKKEERKRPLK